MMQWPSNVYRRCPLPNSSNSNKLNIVKPGNTSSEITTLKIPLNLSDAQLLHIEIHQTDLKYSVASFLLPWTLICCKIHFTAFVYRICNCNKIQNTILTPDEVLNILVYESFHYSRLDNRYVAVTHEHWITGETLILA